MKRYIGDGVYASIENGMIKLTTERMMTVELGMAPREITHTIYLEEPVYQELVRFHDDACSSATSSSQS